MNPSTVLMPAPHGRIVLLAGATGLVGRQLLNLLLADGSVDKIYAVGRRRPEVAHTKLKPLLVDFHDLPRMPRVDEVYLALGTTIRVAGSKEAFRFVDLEAGLAVAKACVTAGAKRVALVSAVSASASSSVFYNRVKGELEDALRRLPLDALVIARPSFLLGNRAELQQPARLGEKIGIWASLLLRPLLPLAYRPVAAVAVARALTAMLPTGRGSVVLTSHEMNEFSLT